MAVGDKGQFIYVVPEKNIVAVFTGDLAGKDSLISKKLLDSYIIPAASSHDPLPSTEKQQARLDTLVNSVTKATPFIWTSEKEGVAKNGVFKRTASPAFQFEYPIGSKKAAIKNPDQVMRMTSPGSVVIYASIVDIPKGVKLENFGPRFYAQDLENHGSKIKVISNNEIRSNVTQKLIEQILHGCGIKTCQ